MTFGYLGQLTRDKGVATLLDAFSELAAEGHHMLVAGRGPLSGDVTRAGSSVTALGWVGAEDKEAFFEKIDCLVVPSQWPEIGPLVALEARGYGVPVAGARIGAIPEHIDANSAPLLFTPGSVREIRGALRRFASDPARYSPTGKPPMSWPEHVDALLGLYDEARARANGRRG